MKLLPALLFIGLFFFSCSTNNVTVDDSLEKYFAENKVSGTFAMLDNSTGNFTIYNLSRYRDSAFLPASTFKIVHSLIGLQTGIISSDTMVIKWDGVRREVPAWNKDLTMYEAFRVSAVPYYQEVARRIGKDRMQYWLDTLSYGNKKVGRIDSFWLDNTLKLSPDEELGFVRKLYFNQLPFHQYYQGLVKKAMLFEEEGDYKLSYKTGLGRKERGEQLAWVVGWAEENKQPNFFVLNLETPDQKADLPAVRMKILKDILAQLGVPGKKR